MPDQHTPGPELPVGGSPDPTPQQPSATAPWPSTPPVEQPAATSQGADGGPWAAFPAPTAADVIAGGSSEPPARGARRRVGRTAVVSTLAVLLVLVVGGAAYGWSYLQRPEVRLARAYDATRAADGGGMTVSLQVTGTPTGDLADAAPVLAGSHLRYAWGPGTQQVVATYDGHDVLDLVTTATHLTVALDLSGVPEAQSALQQLEALGALAGPEGDVLTALATGKPVGLRIGPGSAVQGLIDQAAAGATPSPSASPSLSADQLSALASALSDAVRDHVVVTDAGTDQHGDRLHVAVDLHAVVAQALPVIARQVPALGADLAKADLSELAGVTLEGDAWVQDGRLVRVELPLGPLLAKAPGGTSGSGATLVVELSSQGVVPPAGPVTEISDDTLRSLTEGLGALGGAGGLGG